MSAADSSQSLSKSKEGVPAWDGSSDTFQSYSEAAQLYEQSVPYHKRYLCGPKLQSELTGAAKRLVVGQRPDWISFSGGVETLLSHLRRCLGKPQMPELTDLLGKYFKGTRRRQGEPMGEYITRKCETYLRAQQAMQRLQSYHNGPSEAPKTTAWPWSGVTRWPELGSRRSSAETWTSEASATPTAGDDDDESSQAAAPTDGTTATSEATEPTWGAGPDWWSQNWQSGWGWQAWSQGYHGWTWGSDNTRGSHGPGSHEAGGLPVLLPEWVQAWYLLQDASLEAAERNLVLTATQGQMSLQRIAQELRSQFPESDLKRRDSHRKAHSYVGECLESDLEEDQSQDMDFGMVAKEEMNEEGYMAWSEARAETESALAAVQAARRTLRAARDRQHQVKMNRQYYRGNRESGPRDDSAIVCLRCGKTGHRAAACPAQQPQQSKVDKEHAPFVCFAQTTEQEEAFNLSDPVEAPTTREAVGQGKCVLDCGATKSLGSVHAIEQIMRLSKAGVEAVDRHNRPLFSFGNSTENKCLSTVHLRVSAGGAPGILRVHALDQGQGPVLLSVEALRTLKATIDFENNLMVLRGVDSKKIIPLEQAKSGHLLLPLTEDLFTRAINATAPVPDLKSFVEGSGQHSAPPE